MSDAVTVGILYPGHAAEDDYPALEARLRADAASASVRLPVTITTIGVDEHTPEALFETGSHARLSEGAERLLAEQAVDSVMWACTSGSFVYGWHGAHRQVDQLAEATGRPVSSTSLAFARAVDTLGVQRVAVAASYPETLAAHFSRIPSCRWHRSGELSSTGSVHRCRCGPDGPCRSPLDDPRRGSPASPGNARSRYRYALTRVGS